MLLDSPETQIVAALAPLAAEPVVVKHRVGAFAGTDLVPILRARSSETLVLLGIATSGAVLSTLRHAADEDYRVVVVEDACADADAEVHRVLMEKVFPGKPRWRAPRRWPRRSPREAEPCDVTSG